MVKLTGPAASIAAGGSLADVLTFSSSKGKRYLKRKSKPNQPRTKPQVSIRAAMTFLSQSWNVFSQAARDTWIPIAAEKQISPFNAYVAANLLRFRNHQGMSAATPPTELGNVAASTSFLLTGHVRRLRFKFVVADVRQNWGFYLHHVSGTGIEPVWEDAVHMIRVLANGTFIYDWKPIPAGTYWFTDSRTTYTGKFARVSRWRSAVATD